MCIPSRPNARLHSSDECRSRFVKNPFLQNVHPSIPSEMLIFMFYTRYTEVTWKNMASKLLFRRSQLPSFWKISWKNHLSKKSAKTKSQHSNVKRVMNENFYMKNTTKLKTQSTFIMYCVFPIKTPVGTKSSGRDEKGEERIPWLKKIYETMIL